MDKGTDAVDEYRRAVLAEQEEARAKQTQHLCELFARRITRQSLARGWNTWAEVHWAEARVGRLFANSRARMTKPYLVRSPLLRRPMAYRCPPPQLHSSIAP